MQRKLIAAVLLPILLAGAAAHAAGAADDKAWASPSSAAVQNRNAATPDEALFVEKCGMCHRERGMGTVILARRTGADLALLEKRKDLSADLIRVYVRTGAGNMPRIGRGEVTDTQLAAITRHLLRSTP
jgi:mono/diheme cytochrome c family protein